MRYPILSDIHANQEALDAVMAAASRDGYDEVICCGDVVGYGADPNSATEWVRANVKQIVRGNHDKACAALDDLEWFNPAARASALWTQQSLTAENLEYLRALPRGPVAVTDFQILHGSPLDEDEYLMVASEASMLTGYLETRISFFGHTHVQGGFWFHRSGVWRIPGTSAAEEYTELMLDGESFYLINPGSIGQPRDRDPRAAWAYYEPEKRLVTYRRVNYAVERAQEKIRAAGLPDILARRLSIGQ